MAAEAKRGLKRQDTFRRFSIAFNKGGNICDFLFVFLHTKFILSF